MVVHSLSPETLSRCQELAKELKLDFSDQKPAEYFLCYEDEALVVKDSRQGDKFSIKVDLLSEWDKLKRQKISFKKDLLSRAVGFKGQETYKVFDGTMGLAKDSLHLWHLGCHIVGNDVDSVAFSLVRDALQRAFDEIAHFEVLWGDSFDSLNAYEGDIDCFYWDPMFEDIKKKSAPKKGMAMLRTRNITSQPTEKVIDCAFQKGIKRVVVKRPLKGKQLYLEPSSQLTGKLVRYDLYLR
ncbi:MAG: class I SAM-dependent methyltransferase [Bdellovibrionales bacterium]|nr:class I SAM-dependent methyltransferase [Bdellovibrionales bacterium]NQZ20168.1 class I SAM-dependent methyltransferase [Bdellovibrionales bacterium]